jgi:hypothetical protein
MDEQALLDKLRKIEALMAQPGTRGEGLAAADARRRLMERLAAVREADPPVEHRFGMGDYWQRNLFLALLRRYGLKPYRYRGQRRTTVMVRASRTFVAETLWPEFCEMSCTLQNHLDEITNRVIREIFEQKPEEAEEAPQELPFSGVAAETR